MDRARLMAGRFGVLKVFPREEMPNSSHELLRLSREGGEGGGGEREGRGESAESSADGSGRRAGTSGAPARAPAAL